MTKSWLIRTSNNYIFGPLSKKKILELYQNKSIQENDEICCGNGFWFYVREEKLVQKYLLEDSVQDFNPVSEAMDVLSAPTLDLQDPTTASKLEDTQVINIQEIEDEDDSEDNPEDLVEETMEKPAVEITAHQSEELSPEDKKKSKSTEGVKSLLNNTTLTVIMFLIIVFLLSLVYYRKRILKEIITAINPIGNVYAQADINLKKKS